MNRQNLLDKIRGLLSKTTENGCTEFEALAALDKARAMMDAYEVTEADLQLSKAEAAILTAGSGRDPHQIKGGLGLAVAKFCDCTVFRGERGLVFCGLPADAQFAAWLLDHLTGFVQGELANYLTGNPAEKGRRRFIINGFVYGCTDRISDRLKELCAKPVTASNSRALVVVKSQAIAEKMKAAGIKLGRARSSSRRTDGGAMAAGSAAGNRATFGRRIGGRQPRHLRPPGRRRLGGKDRRMTAIIKFYPIDNIETPLGYLKSFSLNAHGGRGEADFTDNRRLAMRFRDAGAAFEFWRQQSTVQPLRPDGKPNRPLTAYHAEILTEEGSDDGD